MFQPPPASGLPGPPPPPPPPVPIASTHPPFRTAGFHGYAVQFSPFLADRLAVASAAHFGIVGNGRLWVLRGAAPGTPAVPLRVEATFDTQDGLYDLAWSETHEHHVVTASGDGTIKLWDVSLPDPTPVQHWAAHAREVFGVAWRPCGDKRHFASVAWDGALRVWEPGRGEAVAHIQAAPAGVCVYAAAWHPVHAPLLATAAADGCARVWDLRAAANNGCLTDAELARRPPPQDPQAAACPPAGGVRLAHPGAAEVLSVDWNRYAEHVLFTGGVDRVLRVWDTRWPTQPLLELGGGMAPATSGGGGMGGGLGGGHQFAIRKVAASPYSSRHVATVGYDMACRVWDIGVAAGGAGASHADAADPGGRLVGINGDHSEFVFGVDWSLFSAGQLATAAWDETVRLLQV